VKFLNCVVYEYILIKRVTEEVERMLTVVNVSKVFTQLLMLVLLCFIEAARTLLLNINYQINIKDMSQFSESQLSFYIIRLFSL